MRLLNLPLIVVLSCCLCHAQPTGDVPYPRLAGDGSHALQVFLAPDGTNQGAGTRESPVGTYSAAIKLIKQHTTMLNGRVACEFVFLPGRYTLTEPFIQTMNDYSVTGPSGKRWLELGFVGEGDVELDAGGLKIPEGHGVITTSGSGIEIRNLRVVHSDQFGIRLGTGSQRSTNVWMRNVHVDSTFCHGILIGDAGSPLADTVAVTACTITNTNLMNLRGTLGQFGSALKMFGAREVNVDSCRIGRNWGEAICINNSSRVRVRNCTIYDNWAPGVYCDVGSDVVVRDNVFRSNKDTTMFPAGRRGMMGILISTEAWAGSPSDLYSRNIDIANNVFINMAGCLDVWEGSVSFLQKQIVENVRFAHNTCIGMWTTKGNTSTAFVNMVYSAPFPANRILRNIFIGNNIFSVDQSQVGPSKWVRVPAEAASAITYPSNYWSASVPNVGTMFGNVICATLPLSEPGSLLPEQTPSLRGRVSRLPWVNTDAMGRTRANDTTNVGAFEYAVTNDVVETPSKITERLELVYGNHATVQAGNRNTNVHVFSMNGVLLFNTVLDVCETRTIDWSVTLPVFIQYRDLK